MPDHDRAATDALSSTSHNAAVLPPEPSASAQTDSPAPENDTQHRVLPGTSTSLARSPPHRPEPTQLLVSFPRARRHRSQPETASVAGDSDSEADDEGPHYTRRVELSYEGTLWAFERMGENGWINANDHRTARERERPRPVERPRPAPLRVDFPFASSRRNAVRATLPSTRTTTTPQISPRSTENLPENQGPAPRIPQPLPRSIDSVALSNSSMRRLAYSQLVRGSNEDRPNDSRRASTQRPSYAQAVAAPNEAPPENPRRAPSVLPPHPHPSWFHE